MNDSHGLAPDMAITLARNAGWNHVTLRTGFSAEMAERHARMAKEAASADATAVSSLDVASLPATAARYYDAVYQPSFDAHVLACLPADGQGPEGSTHAVVLDATLFYPEGGGQEADHGTLVQTNTTANVLDTQKIGDVIVHFTDQAVEVDASVQGCLDWKRRKQLMDHHTAVHIVGGAARRLLGPHIFQAGSHLSVESGRLDITHYHRLRGPIWTPWKTWRMRCWQTFVIRKKRSLIEKMQT